MYSENVQSSAICCYFNNTHISKITLDFILIFKLIPEIRFLKRKFNRELYL